MNGVSSLLQIRGSGESLDASRGAEKSDSIDGSKKGVTEGDGLKEDASVGISSGEDELLLTWALKEKMWFFRDIQVLSYTHMKTKHNLKITKRLNTV
ncbi:hypothetical protein PIB30_005932 [Stylosanthes scabra]|uniref:Uncharacterized protein n=1 Tax=Stylosanthes scabra TaxID=79078 RepID=A0ABU6S4I4_9FABA|nr:hypothetical protein [Stylosanthes scabra]